MTRTPLLSTLRELEQSAAAVLLRFNDGEEFVVRIISTMHAEAGANVVVEILKPISPSISRFPAGTFVNILLGDIKEIVVSPDPSATPVLDPNRRTPATGGQTMEPEYVAGTSPNGTTPRRLDCWIEADGRLALWIHAPESDSNGWQIHVSTTDLAAALARLGVRLPAEPVASGQ